MLSDSSAAIDTGSWVQAADLLVALVLAAIIGGEREYRSKSAGLRTHTLVGVGAALFMVVSKYGFFDVLDLPNMGLDPSRIAAGVVSGIGFIGGGLVFVRGDVVRGLTTAASVWVAAAVGMAAGAGLWVIAAVATLIHVVVVTYATPLARRLPRSTRSPSVVEMRYRAGGGTLGTVLERSTHGGFTVLRVDVEADDGERVATRRLRMSVAGGKPISVLVGALESVDGVLDIQAVDSAADED